jgi:trehalose 6-phosphate synthase/phosphatase
MPSNSAAAPDADSTAPARRLLIVSNRLPFSFRRTPSGIEVTASSGGLVSALSSWLERQKQEAPASECVWIGWPGAEVEEAEQAELRDTALRDHSAYPVFVGAAEMEQFYEGFCNSTLWPVFHYFSSYAAYREEDFASYQRVNQLFCDAVLQIARPDDEIWVHDYQLFILPALLRAQLPKAAIGFFLHTPFPSFEVFRQLPTRWRRQVLEGVLGADLIGFHTHDYVQYFLRSVFLTLGHEHHLGQLTVDGAIRRVESFPVGVDFEKFWEAAGSEEVEKARATAAEGVRDRIPIFSVDRLDYSKGLLHRLRGYETLLEQRPEWRGKVVFLLVVVPSREQVEQYQRMKQELDELVGQINGAYGSMDWVPIVYQYRSIPFSELVALYALAAVALITPLRDGMNLVAKEYLASKRSGTGVLILSEMAGAARELGEALQINPNHRLEIADAIHEALQMPEEEQIRRNRPMQERLRAYDAQHWATNFLGALHRTKEQQGRLATLHLTGSLAEKVLERYRQAQRRLILLDYDGTLVPFAPQPHLAAPDPELLQLLARLGEQAKNLYLISGRDRDTLDKWFAELPIQIVAEHGAWLRHAGSPWQLLKPLGFAWKEHLRPLLSMYVDRVPGSLLEEKEFSLAWHYRRADPELGTLRAKELTDDLVSYTANFDVQVLEGKKVVEVRNAGVNKGAAALHCVASLEPDFVFAAGDDQTDEDLFSALPPFAATVRVGSIYSQAIYRVHDHKELRRFLARLASAES